MVCVKNKIKKGVKGAIEGGSETALIKIGQ